MRSHLINWGCVGPWLIALVAAIGIIALGLYVVRNGTHPEPMRPAHLPSSSHSELTHELLRCRNLGTRAGADRACLAAWSENRRRFFAGDNSHSISSKAEGGSQP